MFNGEYSSKKQKRWKTSDMLPKSKEDGRQVTCNIDWINVKNSLNQKHNKLINFLDTGEHYILF
jgi:Holliday junction resolvase-like predicted endonuclease